MKSPPTTLVMFDLIGQAFDSSGIQVCPLVEFHFHNETDLHNFLSTLDRDLLEYSDNAVVLNIKANEVVKLNDVLCKFKVKQH